MTLQEEPLASSTANVAARIVEGTKIYGEGDTEVRALDGVTVTFEREKFTAIMGPSGSGKSTLLHCIAGLDVLTSGRVYIGETDLSELNDKDLTLLRRTQVGFIFQSYNLVPTLTAQENILLPLTLAGQAPERDWFEHVIQTVGLLDRLNHRPTELSGGQQQRVAAARALVSRPAIVFGDEPSGNLDSNAGGELLEFMRSAVNQFGQTMVMVTHDPLAAAYADRVVFLEDGQVSDEMHEPTADSILMRMRDLGA
jgi:putative ABC transport system ATP-binding protein